MTRLLEARGLSYRVGSAELLGGVDITVGAGELVAVIGPNGAGKSTLVGLLAGDFEPSAGDVLVSGVAMTDLDLRQLALLRAVLGQHRSRDVLFTVAEVVAMANHSSEADGSDIETVLQAMDVAHLAQRVVGSLSGGEHTRVALARVLLQNTPLVLLDEPLAALDIAHQERVLQYLRGAARQGRGVLAVLHDLNAAAAYADRFVLLAKGKIAAEGTADAVLRAEVLSEVYGHPMVVTRIGQRTVVLPGD